MHFRIKYWKEGHETEGNFIEILRQVSLQLIEPLIKDTFALVEASKQGGENGRHTELVLWGRHTSLVYLFLAVRNSLLFADHKRLVLRVGVARPRRRIGLNVFNNLGVWMRFILPALISIPILVVITEQPSHDLKQNLYYN